MNLTPPPQLYTKVLSEIAYRQKMSALKKKLAVFGLLFFLNLILIAPAIASFKQQIMKSGFGQYIALAILDLKDLGRYWQDLLMSLLESLPVLDTIGLLIITFILTSCTGAIINYGKAMRTLAMSRR